MAQRVKNKPELKIVVSNTPEAPAVEPVPEQVEMPFAIVNGEPVTQMPKDLYIPPQAMEVFLEAFEGPLDLLLYLIRRQNLNILDIPLAEITRQYMQYIEVMTELQLELAGEYMVMAATLAEIKSRMLLPRPKVDPEGREEDPRAELVRRLQEYERFKRAAEDIDSLPRLERDVWTTSADLKDRNVVRLLPTVTLQEMLLAFKDVVVRSEMFAHHHISRERLSVRERMSDVLSRLEQASFVEFVRLFRLEEGRMGVTVTFMALLELVREGLIEIVQAVPFAPIHVRAAGASRKLHVVGGIETLADGTVVDGTTAVVAGEAVVGDVPPVGLLLPGDAGLDSITEQVLDPNFVDEDFEEDEQLLEGIDDVLNRGAAPATPDPVVAPAAAGAGVAGAIELIDVLAAPDRVVEPAAAGADTDMAGGSDGAARADGGADAYSNASLADLPSLGSPAEPVSVVDDSAAAVDHAAATFVPAGAADGSASLTGEAADVHEATPLSEAGAIVDLQLPSSSAVNVPSASPDAVALAVESVLAAGPAEVSPVTAGIEQDVVLAQETSAHDVVAAEFAGSQWEPSDVVVGSAAELDEAGAVVEPISAFEHLNDALESSPGNSLAGAAGVSDVAAPDEIAAPAEHSSSVDETSQDVFATTDVAVAEVIEPMSVVYSAPALDQGAVTIEPLSGSGVSAFGEAAVSSLLHNPTASEEPTAALSEISAAVELAPMSDLSPLADFASIDMSSSGGVTDYVSSPASPGTHFSAPLANLAALDVPPTVNFMAPDQAASPDSTAAHVFAPPGDWVPSEHAYLVATDGTSHDAAGLSFSAPSDSMVQVMPTPESAIPEESSSSLTGDLDSPRYSGESTDLPTADGAPFVVSLDSVGAPFPSFGESTVTEGSPVDDIAVTFDPSVTTPPAVTDESLLTLVSAAASEPTVFAESGSAPAGEPSASNEVGVTIDPAVFDAPIATAESETLPDTPLDRPPENDVQYESQEEAVAAGEEPAVDEDVSLIGETPVAGEVSLVGDESVSGGPAVEVEEFAFDELSALDDAGPADQQPAAGAEAVVNKVPGEDHPSPPGEESDD